MYQLYILIFHANNLFEFKEYHTKYRLLVHASPNEQMAEHYSSLQLQHCLKMLEFIFTLKFLFTIWASAAHEWSSLPAELSLLPVYLLYNIFSDKSSLIYSE